ncbi:MAG TPA: neutral/alkaline non-lysosomal ceramidase N-terminal domain-containing protein [Pseudonocardia sp.]|uniref:neutral/alkaline non-lysosomal ceramidase N-terminal domain-containing protein n=1 Tax=Pseudonocardia sp. TaxID=60912 RepID=UPI002CD9ECA3|nr:neutral/alkaline non-lysosomal ceramidase N-terminal domain-containing protein [Pseudonocardia sp.]HTF47198.1 neutral/alkaline non-lysosomal ceramidase N-terminal domain-containing protein [Pseudonocardia sp.]
MAEENFLVGRGLADVTGEPAGVGMLGYGKADQRTEGIHTRLRARAFVIAEPGPGARKRVLLVIAELPLIFESIRRAVLDRLATRYGDTYAEANVMLTATHTHCGPGGYSHHLLYNTTTGGFRPATFAAIVDGICEAVEWAHADLAPAALVLTQGELHDASANRSRPAFERNPAADRAHFPDGIDPLVTVLRIERAGQPVGAITWFAVHNTSMTNRNRLISSDNKGYAAYHWERHTHGQDYRSPEPPGWMAAFAQTNAGDLSPNLNLRPGSGPTDDEFENTRLIGLRQFAAAEALCAADGEPLPGGVDHRLTTVRLSEVTVRPEFTGDGRAHRTGGPAVGAAALAGSEEDGPAFPGFHEGRNRFWDALSSRVFYRRSAALRDAQAPKALVFGARRLNRVRPVVAEHAPLQLLRIGPLYLVGVPAEVSIVAGLRVRRAVAAALGAELDRVLVAGYSNGYLHYLTTPEEYDSQQYEGGSTLFGRWELPAVTQTVTELAGALADGRPVSPGDPPPRLTGLARFGGRLTRTAATPTEDPDARLGEVLRQPRPGYRAGERVTAAFRAAHPNNDLRRGDSYLEIQCAEPGGGWRVVADDGDWSTRFHWVPGRRRRSGTATITWDIPDGTQGRFRVRYLGDTVDPDGSRRAVIGTTAEFRVTDPAPASPVTSARRPRTARRSGSSAR